MSRKSKPKLSHKEILKYLEFSPTIKKVKNSDIPVDKSKKL
jgi:hypothetical protein